MSDKVTVPTEQEQAKAERRQAITNSANMVKETRKLLEQGHFAGTKALRVVGCIQYLQALETQIRAGLKAEQE